MGMGLGLRNELQNDILTRNSLLMKSAPHTSNDEVERVRTWVSSTFPEAVVDEKNFHGQIRFNVPAKSSAQLTEPRTSLIKDVDEPDSISGVDSKSQFQTPQIQSKSPIASLFATLEANKQEVGYEYYSVGQTTLDQVFLSIVGKHAVEEEGYEAERKAIEGTKRKSFWKLPEAEEVW